MASLRNAGARGEAWDDRSEASHPAQLCRVAEAVCRVSTPAASATHTAPVRAAAGLAAAAAAGARASRPAAAARAAGPARPARASARRRLLRGEGGLPVPPPECRRHRLLRDEGDLCAPTLSLDRTPWGGEVIQKNQDGRDANSEMVVDHCTARDHRPPRCRCQQSQLPIDAESPHFSIFSPISKPRLINITKQKNSGRQKEPLHEN